MLARRLAAARYRRRVALARRAARELGALWRQVDGARIAASWRPLALQAARRLTQAQYLAAAGADDYADDVAEALGVSVDAAGRVVPASLAGVAADGRDLATLLQLPAITALSDLGRGQPVARALTAGRLQLDMITRTEVADAGRVADGVAVAARPRMGYVRMLSLPSCARCIILAGRWYRWNAGFDRHPRCDCLHLPASEDAAGDLRTDARAAFKSMDTAEQDRVFTPAGARAIRDGADINQVVNARRGAAGLTPAGARLTAAEAKALRGGRERGHLQKVNVFGQDLYVTTEGVTTKGLAGVRLGAKTNGTKQGRRYRSAKAPRLMPESIYQLAAGDRAEAQRLLRRFGYLS